jgi:hypothetical protein
MTAIKRKRILAAVRESRLLDDGVFLALSLQKT